MEKEIETKIEKEHATQPECSIIEYVTAFTILSLNITGVIFLTSPGQGIVGSTLIALSSVLSLSYNAYKCKNHQLFLDAQDIEKAQ
jgi:hypothetical protein